MRPITRPARPVQIKWRFDERGRDHLRRWVDAVDAVHSCQSEPVPVDGHSRADVDAGGPTAQRRNHARRRNAADSSSSRGCMLRCDWLMHRPIGRYRRPKRRKSLTSSNVTRHVFISGCARRTVCTKWWKSWLWITVLVKVTCRSGVLTTSFKDFIDFCR